MLITVQDKTRENYTRFLFFCTVRSARGLFLWPGLRAILFVPVTVRDPSLDVTVLLVGNLANATISHEGLDAFSVLLLVHVLPATKRNTVVFESICQHKVPLTYDRPMQ